MSDSIVKLQTNEKPGLRITASRKSIISSYKIGNKVSKIKHSKLVVLKSLTANELDVELKIRAFIRPWKIEIFFYSVKDKDNYRAANQQPYVYEKKSTGFMDPPDTITYTVTFKKIVL